MTPIGQIEVVMLIRHVLQTAAAAAAAGVSEIRMTLTARAS